MTDAAQLTHAPARHLDGDPIPLHPPLDYAAVAPRDRYPQWAVALFVLAINAAVWIGGALLLGAKL